MAKYDRPMQPSGTMENRFDMIYRFLCQLVEKLNVAANENSRVLKIGDTTITEQQLKKLLEQIN